MDALNALIYTTNKSIYSVVGSASPSIARVSAKYFLEYLKEKGYISEVNEDNLKKVFIDLKLCDNIEVYEKDGYVITEFFNASLKDCMELLVKQNIPITITPGIIFTYILYDIKKSKIKFEKVEVIDEKVVCYFKKL